MSEILIGCVVYNQSLPETRTYKSLLTQSEDVFIHDNSPQPLTGIESLPPKWRYVSDPSNPGLSAAYNRMARYARDNGYKWILVVDQDTCFPPDTLLRYRESIGKYPGIPLHCPIVLTGRGGLMSPLSCRRYIPSSRGMEIDSLPRSMVKLSSASIINSGMLINLEAYSDVGGYNEKVFLDFSDYQFVERLSEKYEFARVIDCECVQSFSNDDDDVRKKLARYRLFCHSLKHYECKRKPDKIFIYRVMWRRCFSLMVQTKSIKPIGIIIKSLIG